MKASLKIRITSLLMAATMLLCALPAFAEGEEDETGSENAQTEEELPFEEDIAGRWYYSVAAEVYRRGWMDPVTDEDGTCRFNGSARVTRGEAIDAIWRMMGRPEAGLRIGYADMNAKNPYHDAIDWAGESRVATGVGDGRFGWKDPVTREQQAVMLYRCARLKGTGFSGTWMLLLETQDRDQVSDWAYEAVCWLYMNEVMRGSDGYYLPKGSITRAELAAALVRFNALFESDGITEGTAE